MARPVSHGCAFTHSLATALWGVPEIGMLRMSGRESDVAPVEGATLSGALRLTLALDTVVSRRVCTGRVAVDAAVQVSISAGAQTA